MKNIKDRKIHPSMGKDQIFIQEVSKKNGIIDVLDNIFKIDQILGMQKNLVKKFQNIFGRLK